MIAALLWSLFGTALLALVGIKLPGLEFRNQRVEAAYRKELVYGEDDPQRAAPPTVQELFSRVRHNYFRLYFHYLYFNITRILYLQVDNVFGLFVLFPSIVAGTITLGLLNQITNVFDRALLLPVSDHLVVHADYADVDLQTSAQLRADSAGYSARRELREASE